MTPLERYQIQVQGEHILADEGQLAAVKTLDRLCAELLPRLAQSTRSPFSIRGLFGLPAGQTRGLYLWGGVGRGKTFLMDLFYECLATDRKHRTHFHRFMQHIHQRLSELQGVQDPMARIGEELARQHLVICLDEFFVYDIGDAMILSGLLRSLFENRVVLVTTSNFHPDALYANGLQRDSFLPAIELLKTHCDVFEIGKGVDYRLRQLESASLYLSPQSELTERAMRQTFLDMVHDPAHIVEGSTVEVLGRGITFRMCSDDVIWFDFDRLCRGPRSAFDYVELARLYHAVFLSGLPALDDADLDATRRLINLVDEFYDRRVKLIIEADLPLEAIYTGQRLAFEFERTRSRLLQMQSREYLQREHLS